MSYVVAVANLKGGVGKSTISVNLACALAGKRATVTLIDADHQATAAQYASPVGFCPSKYSLSLSMTCGM